MPTNNRLEDDDGGTIIDDGLSTCDEENLPYNQRMTTAQAAILQAENRKYKRCMVCLLFMTLFIGVIVACVRFYSNPRLVSNENGGTSLDLGWGNGNTEKENEERFQQTLEYLTTRAVSDPATLDLEVNTNVYGVSRPQYTPQYQAALWIAKQDQFRISIPSTTETSREEYPFLQRYALAVFFFSTGGQTWHNRGGYWMLGIHECGWDGAFMVNGERFPWGAFCDEDVNYSPDDPWKGKRTVTHLYMSQVDNNMIGTIPAELRHLRHLKVFWIDNSNGISGRIPFQLETLNELEVLNLADLSLTGTIPHQFGNLKKLKYLRLERNNISGDTTKGDLDFLEKMESLTELVLDYNQIIGTLPESVTGLSKLKTLSLSNTNMYGELPSSMADMTDLMGLYLDDCDFEGSTYALQKLPNLTAVYLENNQFDDIIDDTFFANQKKLVHLDISNCSFSGSIPTHLLSYPDLGVLDMSVNKLDGEFTVEAISDEIFQTNLQFLSMHTNSISGPIPTNIGLLKNLITLDLSLNEFSGEMPDEIGDLTDLSILFLGRNNFTEAPVPIWLRNMTQLTELSLKSASLKGHIPEWLSELTDLTFLDLGENDLFSAIPQSLNSLSNLMVLILNDNRLWGELGLGELSNLEVLLVDGNSLTGNTEEMCQHTLTHFVADCARNTGDFDMPIDIELDCECCTQCCWDEDTTCNDSEWLGNHKGIWEYGYSRVSWDFEDGDVSPLLPYNILQEVSPGETFDADAYFG